MKIDKETLFFLLLVFPTAFGTFFFIGLCGYAFALQGFNPHLFGRLSCLIFVTSASFWTFFNRRKRWAKLLYHTIFVPILTASFLFGMVTFLYPNVLR